MSLSAHYIVSCQTDGWFIMLEGERYGPFLDGQVGALIAAVQAANHAGKDGHDARVLLHAKDGGVSTAWIFGTDSYPSPWVEELHRIALLPRRERAHASVPPGPSMTLDAAVAGQA
ncbi:hypothetical protein [Azospirillum sp. TSO35-2]|jgi:hypothetical protein|uniref:hypothetical protein n=1 Tax=Azospirillum sp. TSO35-2 TaxID=716796 RepID=UPI000D60B8E5|nr:hypothetical protein [Azospirillum sp. TSO35-2]PWC40925.1 hypothetical protein TSO352_00270 [Azospirillum sp. TSO35-2]